MASLPTRWRRAVVLCVSLQFLQSTGPVYSFNVFFADLQREFGENSVATGKADSCLFNSLNDF